MGLPLFSGGKLSEIIDIAHGLNVASPAPTVILAIKSCMKFFTKPEAAVAAYQTAIPAATNHVLFFLSARYPNGNPMVA